MNKTSDDLSDSLDDIQDQIDELASMAQSKNANEVNEVLEHGSQLTVNLLILYAAAHNKSIEKSNDLLEVLKAFVKGDPSLNAIRDNVRELVYYQNCIAQDRSDALPEKVNAMIVHTVRHIYFYLRSRCEQEGLFS